MSHPLTSAKPLKRRHPLSGALVALVILVGSGAAGWYKRAPLLRSAAELWIVSDIIEPADAAVVLGGGLPSRPLAAAEYYREGLVKKVLVSNGRQPMADLILKMPSHTHLNIKVLRESGVPDQAIETVGHDLSNTYEEAVAIRDWAEKNHARRLIIPTEIFSTRRTKWIFEHEIAGAETQIEVAAREGPDYSPADWWQKEKGVLALQNETIKYFYYRFKY